MIGFLKEEAYDLLKFLQKTTVSGDDSYTISQLKDRLTNYLEFEGVELPPKE